MILSTVDISTLNGAEMLINSANSLGPVGGIFHLGQVRHENLLVVCESTIKNLRISPISFISTQVSCESLFDTSTPSHFELLWKIKVEYTKNLDTVARKSCPSLKYFVAFSDIASSFGDRAKSMLGYACAAMESILENRTIDDHPAVSIQDKRMLNLDSHNKQSFYT